MKIRDGGEALIYTNPDMFTLEVHHGGYFVDGLYMRGIVQWVDGQDANEVSMLELFELVKHLSYDEQNIQYYYKHKTNGWVEIRTDKDYFGALKLVKPSQLFVLYITDNLAPRLLNVQSPVFSAQGDKAKRHTKGEKPKRHAKGDKANSHSKSDKSVKSKRHDKGEEGQEGEDEYEDKLEDCHWLLYAAQVGKRPTVRVKTYHPIHTCGRSQRTRFATSQWLAKRFDEDIRTNPNMSVAEFMTLVRKHYIIDVTRDQCYKAKNLANERIQGSIEEQYAKLWDYCEEFKRQNPRSTILVKTSLRGDDPVFKRLYICFA
ncbi:hypothetical protein L3X38_031916 [Prunus dulcis]|uniref:PB1-like domain-containing protein n=1 Tax=Prunus dulcis TaxID=3755 RepID=A0AAD4VD06_PRUDU|nr:hypothetical protein L3X38_031916 [Prunus dulcis]